MIAVNKKKKGIDCENENLEVIGRLNVRLNRIGYICVRN